MKSNDFYCIVIEIVIIVINDHLFEEQEKYVFS